MRKFLSFVRNSGLGPEDRDGKQVNLAHHVRVRRTRVRQNRTILQEEKFIELTAEGHEQLVNELESLKSQRGHLAEEIRRAAADKDVRENAPLEAAREEAGRVESRIREIEATLGNAVVIDANDPTRSQIIKRGTVVEVQDISSEREFKYTLVSASEANPLEFKISDASPLGKVLLGRAAGHEVVADTPRGNVNTRSSEYPETPPNISTFTGAASAASFSYRTFALPSSVLLGVSWNDALTRSPAKR